MTTAVANKNPKDYLKEPYSRILIPDEESGTYAAGILEFPGCHAQGATADEAMKNLEAAAEGWIAAALELGQEIPEPQMNQGYGGKIALRVPRGLHRQAARMAEHGDTSLNQYVLEALAARVGADDLYTRLMERLELRFAKAAPIHVVTTVNVLSTSGQPPILLQGGWVKKAQTTLQPQSQSSTASAGTFSGIFQ